MNWPGSGKVGCETPEMAGSVRSATTAAGATPPLVWRDATNTIERIDGNGPALGMMEEFEYSLAPSIQLEKGDAIIAFTDGLVEALREIKDSEEIK